MNIQHFPSSTYRLQFNRDFTFENALEIVDYLNLLGISHIYCSPLLYARPGSSHGYDIIDHSKFNPEIGTIDQFKALSERLRFYNMGLILDIVPNHMCIAHSDNQLWQDVLENGENSFKKNFFDIDWHPARKFLDGKVLIPILNQQYGEALENQHIKILYQQENFYVNVEDLKIKTDIHTWVLILEPLLEELSKIFSENNAQLLFLKNLIEQIKQNSNSQIFKEKLKNQLWEFFKVHRKSFELLCGQLLALNGSKGDVNSFNNLDQFLKAQHYRICFWRIANDEINYRRFFDIVEYAGLKTEKKEVFDEIHVLIKKLCQDKYIDGLRIDHIDGLQNPNEYLINLKTIEKDDHPLYVIVEKILIGNEKLPSWNIHGTVGYDFLNLLNNLYVFQPANKKFLEIYQQFTGNYISVSDLAYFCKKQILNSSLLSELRFLTQRLMRIAEKNRHYQDFTEESIKMALADIIACFPVYRTYLHFNFNDRFEQDKKYIEESVSKAKMKNSMINQSIYDFIQATLLEALGLNDKKETNEFVMHFQQLTGPVMAKGIEDTAFYRFYPLVSLNEVGSDLSYFGTDIKSFHNMNLEKTEFWPHSMLTTTTHDTKRSEDVRARINVLSEMPEEWSKTLLRWSGFNEKFLILHNGELVPDRNEQYLIYQTLIGTWPLQMDINSYKIRIQNFMEKALREAKIHSNWINPKTEYEENMKEFINKILDSNDFIEDFKIFMEKIFPFGMLNSLSQLIIKLTSSGIPDIYQGNEIWDFSLVDPDNRKKVDFEFRKDLLNNLQDSPEAFSEYCQSPSNGKIKLFILKKLLLLRRNNLFFSEGIYMPLSVVGECSEFIIAFARIYNGKCLIVISGRFFSFFMRTFQNKIIEDQWKNTYLELPPEWQGRIYTNIFSGIKVQISNNDKIPKLCLQNVIDHFPMAVLTEA